MAIPENASRTNSTQQHESAGTSEHEGVGMAAPAFQLDASAADADGLPAGLKYGVERESGFDLSAVRVRRGSSLPAKFGALAIAKGMEVHLAPGQEDKLPHEVWHLVQQWRGIVKPTHQMAGQTVNKDSDLEEEASRMGEKAKQQQPQELDRKQLRQPNPVDVVQCVAVQISLAPPKQVVLDPIIEDEIIEESSEKKLNENTEEKVTTKEDEIVKDAKEDVTFSMIDSSNALISRVAIVGRPEKLFSSSMGDHTTAFSVHQKGLIVALKNKTIEDAARYVGDLTIASANLPGMDDDVIAKSGRSKRLDSLINNIFFLRDETFNSATKGKENAVLLLQRLVATYLEFREQVPFSAMNISAISFGLAGKGKGESGPSSMLQEFEEGNGTHSKQDLREAIIKLLDLEGIANLLSEMDENVREEVLPGIDHDDSAPEVAEKLILQHLMSVEISFPKSYKAAGLSNKKEVIGDIMKDLAPLVKARIGSEEEFLEKMVNDHDEKAKKLRTSWDYINGGKRKTKDGKPTKKQQGRINEIKKELQLKKEYKTKLKYLEELKSSEWLEDVEIEDELEDEIEKTESLDYESLEKNEQELNEKESERQEDQEKTQKIATEVDLGTSDKIVDIKSGGRTDSPFGNSMGAHTTAWVVHVDEIRTRLKGKTIIQAINEMHQLSQAAYNKSMKMIDLIKVEKKHEDLLVNSFNDLLTYGDLEKSPKFMHVPGLQSYINALLTFINFIPGSTVNKTNTDGHGEAKSRKYLLDFEAGLEDDIIEALSHVENLLDINKLTECGYSSDAIKALREEHVASIKSAYPITSKAIKEYQEIENSHKVGKKRKGGHGRYSHSSDKKAKESLFQFY